MVTTAFSWLDPPLLVDLVGVEGFFAIETRLGVVFDGSELEAVVSALFDSFLDRCFPSFLLDRFRHFLYWCLLLTNFRVRTFFYFLSRFFFSATFSVS